MHFSTTSVLAVVAFGVGCANGDPPPRHAGGPSDPAAPEAPIAPSPFASTTVLPSASSSATPATPHVHHEGMDMPMPAGDGS